MTRRMPPWEYINYKLMHIMHRQMQVVNIFEVAFDYGVIRAGVIRAGVTARHTEPSGTEPHRSVRLC